GGVVIVFARVIEAVLAVLRAVDGIAGVLQGFDQLGPQEVLVFHDQEAHVRFPELLFGNDDFTGARVPQQVEDDAAVVQAQPPVTVFEANVEDAALVALAHDLGGLAAADGYALLVLGAVLALRLARLRDSRGGQRGRRQAEAQENVEEGLAGHCHALRSGSGPRPPAGRPGAAACRRRRRNPHSTGSISTRSRKVGPGSCGSRMEYSRPL